MVNVKRNGPDDPLKIHLILKRIKSQLTYAQRLRARSVCKLWREEFSSGLEIKFKDVNQYLEYISSHYPNNSLESEKTEITAFDFTELTSRKCSENNLILKSGEDVSFLFSSLPLITKVTKLTLPQLPYIHSTPSPWYPIFKLFQDDLQELRGQMDCNTQRGEYEDDTNAEINLYSTTIVREVKSVNGSLVPTFVTKEDVIIMKKLTKVSLSVKYMRTTAQPFIKQFFSSIPYLTEFEFNISYYPNSFWIWMKGLIEANPGFLKKLTLLWDTERENNIVIIPFIINIVNGLSHLQNIELNGAKLHSGNVKDFIRILSLYDQAKFRHLENPIKEFRRASAAAGFEGKQLNDVRVLNGIFYYYAIHLQKILFHFPRLENLEFCEYFKENSLMQLEMGGNISKPEWKNLKESPAIKYKNMKRFKYKGHAVSGMTERISEIFPFLTSLHIETYTDTDANINTRVIIANLIKLKELTFIVPGATVTDEDLTGIPADFIKQNLEGKPLKFLINFNIEEIPGKIPGLAGLKDLKKLHFHVDKGSTKLSLLYGICKLEKLEFLGLFLPFTKELGDLYWKYLVEKLENLDVLEISARTTRYNIILDLVKIKPFLKIKPKILLDKLF